MVLKKKCPAIDTVVQYKAGGGGAILWSSANTLPADGLNVYGINLPHVVLQPLEGQVQYKTEDLVPVFWYHFTPDALVVPEASPFKTFADFLKAAKADPGKYNLGGSALNSANHVAHERLNGGFGIKTTYVPYKGTGDLANAVLGSQIDGAMTYTVFAINNKQRVRWRWRCRSVILCCPTCRPSRNSVWTGPTARSAALRCRKTRRRPRARNCRTCSPRSTPTPR